MLKHTKTPTLRISSAIQRQKNLIKKDDENKTETNCSK
jgi:hypothetical protein